MPVEPVELEACRQEGGVTSPIFYYFTIFFYIGACNSPDKLLTIYIYIPNNPKNSYTSFTFYTQSQKHGIKVQTKKVKLYIYFYFLLGVGGGRGVGGVVWLKGSGWGKAHSPGLKCLTKIVTWFPYLGVY